MGQVVNGFFYESAGAPMLFALSAAAALIGLAVWVRFPRS